MDEREQLWQCLWCPWCGAVQEFYLDEQGYRLCKGCNWAMPLFLPIVMQAPWVCAWGLVFSATPQSESILSPTPTPTLAPTFSLTVGKVAARVHL